MPNLIAPRGDPAARDRRLSARPPARARVGRRRESPAAALAAELLRLLCRALVRPPGAALLGGSGAWLEPRIIDRSSWCATPIRRRRCPQTPASSASAERRSAASPTRRMAPAGDRRRRCSRGGGPLQPAAHDGRIGARRGAARGRARRLGLRLAPRRARDLRARNRVERWSMVAAGRLLHARDPDDGRHRAVAGVRERSASSSRCRSGEFLFGLHWSPQTALRADQVGSSGAFGAVPLFVGTLLITAHRHAGRGAGRADVGDLPHRVREPARARDRRSRCSRSWPASRPWSTASSPR